MLNHQAKIKTVKLAKNVKIIKIIISQKPYFCNEAPIVQDGVDSNLMNAVHNCGRIQYHNTEQEAELSQSDRAMRLVSSNLAN